MAMALKRRRLAPALVIDGGANIGQFARAMVETFTSTHVHSFEPVPDVARTFRANLGDHRRVTLHEAALGSTEGVIPFFRHEYTLASSALESISGSERMQRIEVPVVRLDLALDDVDIPSSTLLKLDLQGFELEALRGATDTLQRVGYVLLEVGLRPSYVGEPLFDQLYDLLRSAGLHFLGPVDVLTNHSGEAVQMDALFGRRTA
jgi:FkbM family methyltransferase